MTYFPQIMQKSNSFILDPATVGSIPNSFSNPLPSEASFHEYCVKTSQLEVPTVETSREILTKLNAANLELPRSENIARSKKDQNRYSDILPYDQNIVSLRLPNFYYNASPIQVGNQCYIAAQGPMEFEMERFWNIVQGYNAELIIALTDEYDENGWSKCAPYWDEFPDEIKFHSQTVISKNDSQSLVSRIFWNERTKKKIVQLHYCGWIDGSAPNVQMLGKLIDSAEEIRTNLAAPIVVHCTAGCGRTGVFIACHSLKQHLKTQPRTINIPNWVFEMRRQRPMMIQKTDQLIAVYKYLSDKIE